MKRPRLFIIFLIAGLNFGHSANRWIWDRVWDFCMASAGDNDWTCDEMLTADDPAG